MTYTDGLDDDAVKWAEWLQKEGGQDISALYQKQF